MTAHFWPTVLGMVIVAGSRRAVRSGRRRCAECGYRGSVRRREVVPTWPAGQRRRTWYCRDPLACHDRAGTCAPAERGSP